MKKTNMRCAPQQKGAPVSVDAPAASVPSPSGATGGVPCDSDSKWVRLPRAGSTLRGFSRSFLFQLCKAGLVESVMIQGPPRGAAGGAERSHKTTRGVRLILLSSLDDFLAQQQQEQAAARETKAPGAQ
jgi:hypothetical protein